MIEPNLILVHFGGVVLFLFLVVGFQVFINYKDLIILLFLGDNLVDISLKITYMANILLLLLLIIL